MPFSIATWNINSVRLRMPLVERLLREYAPDVLCLQETKCPDELFPFEAFAALGYVHIAINGQKGYHGVATVSRRPLEIVERRRFCEIADCRHLSTRVEAGGRIVLMHNFYVPAGGDEPDPGVNPKFRHKLDFVAEMHAVRPTQRRSRPRSSSATSTSRRSNTTSGRTSSCSTWSAIRRSRPKASRRCARPAAGST